MDDVGRYRVTRRVGSGGMAEVFEGVAVGSEGFSRRVAIKRMRAENAAAPAFGRMFLDEARIASQLHHANIVSVLDYGVADGHPFQVLEFVDGVDVNRLIAMGRDTGHPLPVAVALAICTDIAHALDHAHTAVGADGRPLGIVHRDVKPGNILVSWGGDVKLVDFGIAFAHARTETTSAGLTKGTLLYMAPEQVMRGGLDGRTDVFALGCVLHALIAGQSPLAQENAMANLVAGAQLPISRDLPDDVYDIVVRATRLARQDRFPTAADMATALGTALARRIDRDARTLLQDYLATLRPREITAPVAGRLDALLGGELVFSGLKSSEPPGHMVAPPVAPAAPPAEADPDDVVPTRRRAAWWLGAAAPVVAVVAAVAVWSPTPAPAVASSGIIDAATTPPPRRDAAAIVNPPPPAIDAGGTRPELPDATPRRPDPGPKPPPRRPSMPPAPVPAPNATIDDATGVLVIGGDGALRAEILVDGVSQGFAPRRLTLPVGAHEITLIKPDGTRLQKRVTLGAAHTASAPQRWTLSE